MFIMKIGGYDLTFIKENILDGVNNGFSFKAAAIKTYNDFFSYFGLYCITITLLVIYKFDALTTMANRRLFYFLFYSSIALLCYSFMTGLKVGSAHNYFNEFLLFLILLTGYLMKHAYEQYQMLFRTGLMIFSLNVSIIFAFYYFPKYQDQHTALNNNEINVNLVKEYLKENLGDKYFFSSDRVISLSLPGQCILLPLEIHNLTYKQKVYNYDSLKQALVDGSVKYFISTREPDVLFGVKIKENYDLAEKFGPYKIYHYSYSFNTN